MCYRNCTITVIERSLHPRHTGQQIDIRGFGVDVMRRMGIEDAVRAKLVHEPGMMVVDAAGRRRVYFKMKTGGKGDLSISSEFEIMRGDLCELLEGLVAGNDGVEVKYGVVVKEMREWEGEEGVRVVLEGVKDGSGDGDTGTRKRWEEHFDLVIGCDGTRSSTRKMMLDDCDNTFHTKGAAVAWTTIPKEDGDTNDFTWFLAPGGRLICTRMDSPHCLRVLFTTGPLPEGHPIRRSFANGTLMEQRKAWADHFHDAGWKSERIATEVARSELAADFHAAELGTVRMEKWYRGRVALLGDAAFCAPPTGWGTAMAFVGAYVLAGELASHCGLSAGRSRDELDVGKARAAVPNALRAYDETVRPLITKMQKASKAGTWLPKSKLAIAASITTMSLIETLNLDGLLMRMSTGGGTDFGWKLPEYEELGRPDQ